MRNSESLKGYVVVVASQQRARHRHIVGHSEVANAFFEMREDAERHLERWAVEPWASGGLIVRAATLIVGRRVPRKRKG